MRVEAKTNGANRQGDECGGKVKVFVVYNTAAGNISQVQRSLCTVTVTFVCPRDDIPLHPKAI